MKKILPSIFFLALFAGCSILGIHPKIHNPHRAGKYPKRTEARVLLGNQESKYRTCYDVKKYVLSVSFGENLIEDKAIRAHVSIIAEARTAIDTLQIDLKENMAIEQTSGIWVARNFPWHGGGTLPMEIAKYYRKENAIFLVFSQPLEQGKMFLISVSYEGAPAEAKRPPWSGGFVREKDDLKQPWWGVACQSEGASTWWPCKDVINDEPDTVDMYYSVPRGFIAVGNGVLMDTSSTDLLNGRKTYKATTYHWQVSNPINIYNITFYIGNYKLLHDTYYSEVTHDTLQLNHYVLGQHYDKANTHFQQVKKYIAFYEKTFGPYPWYRDGFKLVESPYAGMEHQSAIAYGNGFENDLRNGFDYIILHETAHEWWGNAVTGHDLAEGWIHEGFTTYTEALYVEETKGKYAYQRYLLNYRFYIINRRPVVGEKGIRYFNYKDSDIYMKGAWILHSLRHTIANDSVFFDILRSFYMENRMKQISSEVFEELVNRKTGKDFHWFFAQYLHNRFTPELEYCVKDGTVYYRWNAAYTNKDFDKLEVSAIGVHPENAKDSRGGYGGATFDAGKITPTLSVQSFKIQAGCDVKFEEQQALFKATENKSLAKEFKKQK